MVFVPLWMNLRAALVVGAMFFPVTGKAVADYGYIEIEREGILFVGLQRAKGLVQSLQPLSAEQRLEVRIEHARKRVVPVLLKHRYIAIIVALNVPGNAVIGGGGSIALLAGLSGLFTFPRILASVSLAALPVPLVVILVT